MNRPKLINQLLDSRGDLLITDMTVYRRPLSSYIIKAVDFLTAGKFSERVKKLNYDELFHLFLVVELSTGESIVLEKNQRVTAYTLTPELAEKFSSNGLAFKKVKVPPNLSLYDFVSRVEKYPQIYVYSAQINNCQLYVSKLLEESGLLTSELEKFIKQDIKALLPEKFIRKIASGITTIAGLYDYIAKGGSV